MIMTPPMPSHRFAEIQDGGHGKFPVHKWESNMLSIESANMPNPGKILGHVLNCFIARVEQNIGHCEGSSR